MQKTRGFVLIVVLLFLFVITLLAFSGSDTMIMENKMQSRMVRENSVFLRAKEGMQNSVFNELGVPFTLPDSPISLTTHIKTIHKDECGNKTLDITSIAQYKGTVVVLNSEDIFAKVPLAQGCKKIPAHQIIWFSER